MKLAQRIMHIFNTRMNSGILYELDMRLRPSGNSGVLVIHLDTFAQYQHEDAWTWEHQALVRARMIYGNRELASKFSKIRRNILSKPRDTFVLKGEITNMREKMRSHLDKSTETMFDIKQGVGGLVDIEFLAQYLVLANASKYRELLSACDNLSIFKLLKGHGLLHEKQQEVLSKIYQKLRALGHQAMMQNEGQLINQNSLVNLDEISDIWQEILID
jgi:glutamate-ammonia-ligase adenylyltransferase